MALPRGSARGVLLLSMLAIVGVARAQSGACCYGEACVDVEVEQQCEAYACDVAALLPPTFAGCYGDVDGNGFVNAADRGFVSAAIGQSSNEDICRFDLDGNGVVDASDRGFVSANIGGCSPLPDFQNGSGQSGGDADPRFPAPTFSPGLTCDEVDCRIEACAAITWDRRFGLVGTNNLVRALLVFNDGQGDALYVGGTFTLAGNAVVNYIAKWDGADWSPLVSPGGIGMDGPVYSLGVYDDGTGPALFAGGAFTTAGGIPANRIAKWNGVEWSSLSGPNGNGMNNEVNALQAFDDGSGPALFAVGAFTTSGGVITNRVARWNGTAWSALAGVSSVGVNGNGRAAVVWDDGSGDALYVGGHFTSAGGTIAHRVARWNGAAWSALTSPLGQGTNGNIEALTVFDDGTGAALFAGGSFTTAASRPANRVARYGGGTWSALTAGTANGVDNTVYSLAGYHDGTSNALYVGGDFVTAGAVPASRVAKWTGSAWEAVTDSSEPVMNAAVRAMAVFDSGQGPVLYAAGAFDIQGGASGDRIAKWDGEVWTTLAGPNTLGLSGDVRALRYVDDPFLGGLYAGGEFDQAGAKVVGNIARWDGAEWTALAGPQGAGTDGRVLAVASYDDGTGPALFVGGTFSAAGGVAARSIAKWDGQHWSPLIGPTGEGVIGTVSALEVYDDGSGPALYVGGTFSAAGGIQAEGIMRWNGTTWSQLGSLRISNSVWAMTVHDDGTGPALFAAGDFSILGVSGIPGIVKWGSAGWASLLPEGSTAGQSHFYSLASLNDGSGPALYAGKLSVIVRWDGVQFSGISLGGGSGVHALCVQDDGSGTAMFAGGNFTSIGGVACSRLARYQGGVWSPITQLGDSAIDRRVWALAGVPMPGGPALFVGGEFSQAGSRAAGHIARWGCVGSDED